jgi:3-polyprenyl-4-hydroxybenzoate decarboxylase
VAQSLYDTISAAATAYGDAELAIQNARTVGMLVSPLEGQLSQANTDLITARAAQHTLDIETVTDRADKARTTAEQVRADAEAAIAANDFRRRAMIIAVAIIALIIVALYLLKLELDRRLEADS